MNTNCELTDTFYIGIYGNVTYDLESEASLFHYTGTVQSIRENVTVTSGEYRVPQNGIQIRDSLLLVVLICSLQKKTFAFSTTNKMTPTKSSDSLQGSWRPVLVESGTGRISGSWKIVVSPQRTMCTMNVERIPETTLCNPYITVVSPSDGPFNQTATKTHPKQSYT